MEGMRFRTGGVFLAALAALLAVAAPGHGATGPVVRIVSPVDGDIVVDGTHVGQNPLGSTLVSGRVTFVVFADDGGGSDIYVVAVNLNGVPFDYQAPDDVDRTYEFVIDFSKRAPGTYRVNAWTEDLADAVAQHQIEVFNLPQCGHPVQVFLCV